MLVTTQLSVPGVYRPPLLSPFVPPQTIISLPVHTTVCRDRADGTFAPVLVVTQLLVPGVYRPPLFRSVGVSSLPPQTIISLPVHTALCRYRATGTFAPVLVGTHVSVPGVYRPPSFKLPLLPLPPQTIISLPVHTAAWR